MVEEGDVLTFHLWNQSHHILFVYLFCLEETGTLMNDVIITASQLCHHYIITVNINVKLHYVCSLCVPPGMVKLLFCEAVSSQEDRILTKLLRTEIPQGLLTRVQGSQPPPPQPHSCSAPLQSTTPQRRRSETATVPLSAPRSSIWSPSSSKHLETTMPPSAILSPPTAPG